MSERFFFTLKWITFLFFLFLFAYKIGTFIDPDLGWHLRAGEIVAISGHAPTIDPWGYVLQGHAWIDHEWLVDLLLWSALTNGNWLLIESLFLIASFLPVAIWIARARSQVQLLYVSGAAIMVSGAAGIRPQMLSFLLFFLLYEFLFSLKESRVKMIGYLLLPLYFAFWANIHAGFVAGLALWALSFIAVNYEKIRQQRSLFRVPLRELAIILLSIGGTLLTPYHIDLWYEIFLSTTSPLIAYIGEWQPALSHIDIILIAFIGSSAALIVALRKLLSSAQLLSGVFFFFSYMQHARMGPFFFVTILPLIETVIASLEKHFLIVLSEFQPLTKKIMLFIPSVILAVMLTYAATSDTLREPYHPPRAAIHALRLLPSAPCRTFNEYGFGGWMIFDDPSRQIFIDGRGPHWRGADGKSPFQEYLDLYKHPETWKKLFATYDICTVILPGEEPRKKELSVNAFRNDHPQLQQLYETLVNLFYPETNSASLANTLLAEGWCRVYQDERAMILTSPGSKMCRHKENTHTQ